MEEITEDPGQRQKLLIEAEIIIQPSISNSAVAKFKQKIIVRSSLKEWENRLKISYLVVDTETGNRLIRGYSVQVAVDIKSGEMLFASPPVLFKKLGLKAP